MARKRAYPPLGVYLNARLVGRLRRETSGAIDFQYDAGWLAWEQTFPVSLSLPLREDRYVGEPVIAVFDNLLPDNDDIRRRITERSRANGTDAYHLLAAIGRDCVGALQFLPEGVDPGKAGEIVARPVSDADIARTLANLASAPLGLGEDQEFRISIAGVQDKTAFLHWKGAWYQPQGTSATTHIFKPPIGHDGMRDLSCSVENEHLCMQVLAELGIPVAHTRIATFAGQRALVIEPFDRQWTRDGRLLRVPQEDCCQALSSPPTRKYQSDGGPSMGAVFELLKASDEPADDQLTFLKAQLASWRLAAVDGHAKNFSLRLHPGGGFRSTPLYDLMSAQPQYDNRQIQRRDMKLAMSVGDGHHYQVHEILPRHYDQTAARAGLPASMDARDRADTR